MTAPPSTQDVPLPMPRPLFADPKTDFVFQRIFGNDSLDAPGLDALLKTIRAERRWP